MKHNAVEKKDTITILKSTRYLLTAYNFYTKNEDSLSYYYKQGLQLSNLYSNLEYQTNYKFIWADHLVSIGNYYEALQLFQNIETTAQKNDYSFLPNIYDAYARLLYYLKDYEKSFKRLKQEAAIFERRNELNAISAVYNNLGILYKGQQQKDSALYYHNKSLKISTTLKDTLAIVQSYNNLGQTYESFNDITNAITLYDKAFTFSLNHKTSSLISNYTNLLIIRKEYKKAETLLTSTLNTETNKTIQKDILQKLATLKKIQKQYKDALLYQEQFQQLSATILDETKIKEIERLKTEYETQKKEQEIKDLQEKSRIQENSIKKNKILVSIVLIALVLLLIIFILYTHNKTNKSKIVRLKLQQQLLRSQMNPHFIFNALSNIQTNILKKENDKAINYLVKFSNLLRYNLENSNLNTIGLQQELVSIKDYLELQKMRLNQPLQYHINIDETIEAECIKIPAMLLQPIIENAIEHGIEKIENPVIKLYIEDKNDILQCTIEDNGIGYSNTINTTNTNKKSFATKIIKQRLKILSKKTKNNCSYHISDVIKNNTIIGTVAVIQLPIINQ